MYQLTDVTKAFRKGHETVTALKEVTLEIGDGEWLAIQGRTGHGKTTLLYILGAWTGPAPAASSSTARIWPPSLRRSSPGYVPGPSGSSSRPST